MCYRSSVTCLHPSAKNKNPEPFDSGRQIRKCKMHPSLIQTVLSAPESHRIMRAKCGSRAIPPVGSFTPPRRIPVVNICEKSLFFFTNLIINDFFKESIPIVSEIFPEKRS